MISWKIHVKTADKNFPRSFEKNCHIPYRNSAVFIVKTFITDNIN